MPIFSSLIFRVVRWAASKGLHSERENSFAGALAGEDDAPEWAADAVKGSTSDSESVRRPRLGKEEATETKLQARWTGIRGETYAYWYLRRQGYVFVARDYMPRGAKDEIDLIGYDGKTLAFVEVRTRTVREELTALPQLSVTTDKQRTVVRTARRFLGEGMWETALAGSMCWQSITGQGCHPKCDCTKMLSVHRCSSPVVVVLMARYNSEREEPTFKIELLGTSS
jgi:Holliday junction resolvase-like predicted endonuclease